MRFLTTLILLMCVSIVIAQSTKIDEAERARLENQFKALKTFYINDDGLVVYQTQESDSASDERSYSNVERERDTRETETNVNSDIPVTNYNETTNSTTINEEYQPDYSSVSNSSGIISINKRPVNPNLITSETTGTNNYTESNIISETPVIDEQRRPLPPPATIKTTTEKPVIAETVEEVIEATDTKVKEEDTKTKRTSSKKSVFDKAPLKYKDMEEAAMAVDDLLDKLKKEQAQNGNNSGSMSSIIARGAGRSTLRKQTISEDNYPDNIESTQNSRGVSRVTETTSNESQTGNSDLQLPTYFINGVQVDKIEVDRLRKSDIIRREVRTRNTVSGNPAGEIWYEVKEYYN